MSMESHRNPSAQIIPYSKVPSALLATRRMGNKGLSLMPPSVPELYRFGTQAAAKQQAFTFRPELSLLKSSSRPTSTRTGSAQMDGHVDSKGFYWPAGWVKPPQIPECEVPRHDPGVKLGIKRPRLSVTEGETRYGRTEPGDDTNKRRNKAKERKAASTSYLVRCPAPLSKDKPHIRCNEEVPGDMESLLLHIELVHGLPKDEATRKYPCPFLLTRRKVGGRYVALEHPKTCGEKFLHKASVKKHLFRAGHDHHVDNPLEGVEVTKRPDGTETRVALDEMKLMGCPCCRKAYHNYYGGDESSLRRHLGARACSRGLRVDLECTSVLAVPRPLKG